MRPMICAALLLATAANLMAQNAAVSIHVDAAAARHRIDPRIYGVAFATTAQLADLNVPLHRWGGNATTRYNWQLNATNHASDYFFESIGEESAVSGAAVDDFIRDSRAAGADSMITLGVIGWAAKLGPNREKLASFLVSKYGPQQYTDPYWPDAGNGVKPNGSLLTNNDPHDANIPIDATFQEAWVHHLMAIWGSASQGGVRYYLLDNEPSLWQETHRDVQPNGASMDETLAKMSGVAARVRAADPGALLCGPEEWGWLGYLYSGADKQFGEMTGWSNPNFPDRLAHGGQDYLPWLVGQLRTRGQIDVLTVHYYPQSGEFSDDTSDAVQLLRNRSTRSLWDPNYVDESWIGDKVRLIPRLRAWAGGLPIGITEYNWGAETSPGGAVAQADVLGIFGREGVDLAVRWTTPPAGSPAYEAIRLYRNYDGATSGFGDVSVSASGPNPDNVAVFAALRSSDGALTVMVLNKALRGTTPATIDLANFNAAGRAQRWQLAGGARIARQGDASVTAGSLSADLPPLSVTLFVVPAAGRHRAAAH